MRVLSLSEPWQEADGMATDVLLEEGALKVRLIRMAAGTRIPPCRMQEDVVFVVVTGRVTFHAEEDVAEVAAPGALYIPGGAVTRSMEAHEESLVVGVVNRPNVVHGTIDP